MRDVYRYSDGLPYLEIIIYFVLFYGLIYSPCLIIFVNERFLDFSA